LKQPEVASRWTKQINLGLESIVGLVAYLGILGVSAIPTVLMKDIGINVAEFALYNLVFIVALLFCSFPVGLLAHKYGGKKIVSIAIVVIALSDIAFGSSASYQEQLVSRVLLGVGVCSWWISAPENIVFTFGKKKAALPLAIWLGGYAVGQAVSYPIAVLGATTIGWRLTYQIFGVICFLVAILYFFAVKIPRSAPSVTIEANSTARRSNSPYSLFSSIPHERSTVLLGISIFFQFVTWIGVLTFFPLYLFDSGFSLVLSGLLSFGLVALSPPAMIFGGFLAVKLKKTVPVLLLGLALLSTVFFLPFVVAAYGISPLPLFIIMGAIGVGLALPDIAWTFLSEVLPISGRGSVNFAIVNAFGFTGSILGTYLPPLVFGFSPNGWMTVWIVYGVFSLISLSVAFFLRKEENEWFRAQNDSVAREVA
jgi:MFS family permease